MKNILIAIFALLLFSCENEITSDLFLEEDSELTTRASNKTDVCHKGRIISLKANALRAHQAHGDAVDMDGDGFFDIDNPCSETDCDDTTYDLENSCACVEGELEVTLTDGSIIYVHPTDNSEYVQWGEVGNDVPGLVNIGTFPGALADLNGQNNTATIVDHLGNWNGGDYAANLCATLSAESGCDWYLPASGELSAIYEQLGPNGTNAIPEGYYWSSSEGNPYVGWVQIFNTAGNRGHFSKNNGNDDVRCRCVRR